MQINTLVLYYVSGVTCPSDLSVTGIDDPTITGSQTLVSWNSPVPIGFTPSPSISYRLSGTTTDLTPSMLNGVPRYLLNAGTNIITTTATNGVQTAVCTFQVDGKFICRFQNLFSILVFQYMQSLCYMASISITLRAHDMSTTGCLFRN